MAVILAIMSLFYKYVQDTPFVAKKNSDEETMGLVEDSSAAGNYESSLKTDMSEL